MSMPATAQPDRAKATYCQKCSGRRDVKHVLAPDDGTRLGPMCRPCRKEFWRVSS